MKPRPIGRYEPVRTYEELEDEIARLRLTDEEREAIYRADARLRTAYVPDNETAATLRQLLERMGP